MRPLAPQDPPPVMSDITVRMWCCIRDDIIVPGAPFNVMLIPWTAGDA